MTREERTAKWNKNFRDWGNFSDDDNLYVVIGETYEIKDELKKKGAKYSRETGWTFKHPVQGYKTVEVKLEDIAYTDEVGKLHYKPEVYDIIKQIQKDNTIYEETGKFIGPVGEKFSLQVVCTNLYQYYGVYGLTNIYTFKTEYGDTLVWSTSKTFPEILEDIENGSETIFELSGTIKDHKTYKGERQTVVTRCTLK